uniref:LAGLIDADG endonuclease n=1 Tax=Ganoderma calidophilum TaxID=2026244 RepID=A0A2S1WBK8_9APHY|nr:hypothetical protein [Ganoderma calidophilum]AWJ63973.1 hypothetical protein [Ganoderma calidophilum]
MFINTTFNISLIIKLIFLITFILITIYLLSLENEINIRSNSKPLLLCSSRFTKSIRDGIVTYGPAIIAYQSLIDRWSSTETKSNPNTTSKENESQPIETSKENDHGLVIKNLKATIQIQKEEINIHKAQIRKLEIGKATIQTEAHEKYDKLISTAQNNVNSKEKVTISLEKLRYSLELKILELAKEENLIKLEALEASNTPKECEQAMKNYFNETKPSESSVIDFDLQSFLNSLSTEELLAFAGILLNSLVLSHTISIILTLYGDYLINKFNLEDRYPRLAKLINLRRTLQAYYLKISLIWIFLAVIPQLIVYIMVLEPRLVEIFNIFM